MWDTGLRNSPEDINDNKSFVDFYSILDLSFLTELATCTCYEHKMYMKKIYNNLLHVIYDK